MGRGDSRALLNLVKFEMPVSYSNGKVFGLFDLCDSSKEMSGPQVTFGSRGYIGMLNVDRSVGFIILCCI